MSSTPALENARAVLARADATLDKLRDITPCLIDVSLRETPVGSNMGQTLAQKLELLPKLREFGFRDIILGALNYAMPEELQVDDDFMVYLRDHHVDMTGCFALTSIGLESEEGVFTPHPSQQKLKSYGIPNTVHEIFLSNEGMQGLYDLKILRRSLPASIQWLRTHIRSSDGQPPRILVNIVDGCDAFAQQPETAFEIVQLLAQQPIEGLSLEDGRGTYMPFQIGAFTAATRSLLPPSFKLFVHIHAGAGYENAAILEALLNGADGVWAGLTKDAAIIGHASLGELIANLLRTGNPNLHHYRLEQLLPLTQYIRSHSGERNNADVPVLGDNAYRLTLSAFQQRKNRFMDLAPEQIGGTYSYRICPLVSDAEVIAGRLKQIEAEPGDRLNESTINHMIKLMRRDLRAGKLVDYDKPENLLDLMARATTLCTDN